MAMPGPDQSPAGWDATAAAYEDSLDAFTARYAEEAIRLTGAGPGTRVLDVAAGCGSLTLLAARHGAEVVAVDFSPAMIGRLRARLQREGVSGVTAAVMDGQRLELPDRWFDAAVSVFGLIFFADRARGLREMWRVLKPGGVAAVVAWSAPERMATFPLVRRALQAAVPDYAPPARPPSWQELQDPARFEAELRAAGFAEASIHPVTREWTVPSAEWLWAKAGAMSPALSALFERLGDEAIAAAGRLFVADLRRRFGDGPVTLTGDALIGVGRRGQA
jgi:ubiquinone/menaquinone biosynthesis C-methylase UbiE